LGFILFKSAIRMFPMHTLRFGMAASSKSFPFTQLDTAKQALNNLRQSYTDDQPYSDSKRFHRLKTPWDRRVRSEVISTIHKNRKSPYTMRFSEHSGVKGGYVKANGPPTALETHMLGLWQAEFDKLLKSNNP
jgi:hypothetical protein